MKKLPTEQRACLRHSSGTAVLMFWWVSLNRRLGGSWVLRCLVLVIGRGTRALRPAHCPSCLRYGSGLSYVAKHTVVYVFMWCDRTSIIGTTEQRVHDTRKSITVGVFVEYTPRFRRKKIKACIPYLEG